MVYEAATSGAYVQVWSQQSPNIVGVSSEFFGGLTEAETAEALGISVATVKRDWEFARAWLIRNFRST